MDARANYCVWIPPGWLSEASFIVAIVLVLLFHLYFYFNIQNCLISVAFVQNDLSSATFMKSILTLILCNLVMYEMVNKCCNHYSLVYDADENMDF